MPSFISMTVFGGCIPFKLSAAATDTLLFAGSRKPAEDYNSNYISGLNATTYCYCAFKDIPTVLFFFIRLQKANTKVGIFLTGLIAENLILNTNLMNSLSSEVSPENDVKGTKLNHIKAGIV
uniref:Uncharacterized protein n=1 Tax=Glossina pallidipes TaxID=7398 RepID=A0A1A9ZWE9_GLOPL